MTEVGVKGIAHQGMHAFESISPHGAAHFPAGEGWSRISYGIL